HWEPRRSRRKTHSAQRSSRRSVPDHISDERGFAFTGGADGVDGADWHACRARRAREAGDGQDVNAQQIGGVRQDSPAIRVVGVGGSLRTTSATRMAVRCALLGAEAHGAYTQVGDLAAYDLPFLWREQEVAARMAVAPFLAAVMAGDGDVLRLP